MRKTGIFAIYVADLQVHELKPKRVMRNKYRPPVIINEMRYEKVKEETEICQ